MTNYGNIIRRTLDNSYVINDNTYHVPNMGEWVDQWADVHAYALAHPECVTDELPPPPPTEDELRQAQAERVRAERDRRLALTDYLIMPDYPLTLEDKDAWTLYRQALRDITKQPGFPWTGDEAGEAAITWPVRPDGKEVALQW